MAINNGLTENLNLPYGFIDTYFNKSNPTYILVFILALSKLERDSSIISISDTASYLNIMETDVIRAWQYWEKEGLVDFDMGTHALEFKNNTMKSKPKREPVLLQSRPNYSPGELSVYIEKNDDIRKLFESARTHLGRLLTENDMSVLLGFNEWLGLPFGIIEILLAYCSSKNHRNMRYIEKVAADWADNAVVTEEAAKERIELYNNKYRVIMRAFGQSSRDPSPAEEKYMKTWVNIFKFPTEIIILACERSILKTGKTSFSYTNTILESWHKAGVACVEDIEKLDMAYTAHKSKGSASSSKNIVKDSYRPKSKNRFINSKQRKDYDFEEFERLARESLKKDMEG